MHIVQLQAENVKRLNAVSITPDGNLVVVGGRNAQGKSSVLDSIAMALAGKKAHGAKPVREGKDKAKVTVDLGDMVVVRTITATGGGTIKVTTKDGASYPSPQAILDGLCSRLSFDPLAFMRERPADQRDMLQGLVGLDFSAMDAERKALFDERTNYNRGAKEAAAKLAGMGGIHADAPEQLVDVGELLDKLGEVEAHNKNAAEMREAVVEKIEALDEIKYDLQEAELFAPLHDEIGQAIDGLTKKLDKMALPELLDAEEAALHDKIRTADEVNSKVRHNLDRAGWESEIKRLSGEAASLTKKIEAIDARKADAMASAKFPVEGLAFDEGGITYDGIPFGQCSSAEQLRVSVAMGIAMNPKLRVLLIRDGSLLDEENLALVAKMAAEHDAQVWIERVGKGQECSVIIEDGNVQGQ